MYAVALAIVTLVACARVASTYRVFNQVVDEPAHIAAGMQLLSNGHYDVDPTHPPLARALFALGPFLDGIRYRYLGDQVGDGDLILYAHERYLHNLTRARLGSLPFFVVAILVVAAWTRALAGDAAAIAAAALFSNEPSVLAHAGLATTDMAATASTITAAYLFWRWLRDRNHWWLGAALAFAFLCKFSALLFVPAAIVAVVVVERTLPSRALRSLVIAAVAAAVLICAGYHFDLPPLWHGLTTVRMHSELGHLAYAMGRWSETGWWWYFLLVIAVKTTIGFLALLLAGAARREIRAPLLAGAAIVLVSLPVHINIGVRHILPAYPFFAVAAGAALVGLWETRRALAGVLAAAAIVASFAAHPDYLPYFNLFAGSRPDNVLLDSNLDWGQDLLRLEREVQRRHIDADGLWLAYSGTAQPDHHGLPYNRRPDPLHYTPGWVAVSEMVIHDPRRLYRWLELFQPVTEVGKSIRLYYVPAPAELAKGRPAIPTEGAFDRILLPVWFPGVAQGGSTGSWQCDLVVHNAAVHDVPVRTRPGAPPVLTIAPGVTWDNPPLDLGWAKNGALLYVPRGDAAALHFNLHLHPPGAAGIVIPVLPEQMASSSTLHFIDVPLDDNSRATVRVYDLTGTARQVALRASDLGGGASIDRDVTLDPGALPAAEINLVATFPEMRGHRVRLEVQPPSAQFWAFVSVTRFPAKNMFTMLPE